MGMGLAQMSPQLRQASLHQASKLEDSKREERHTRGEDPAVVVAFKEGQEEPETVVHGVQVDQPHMRKLQRCESGARLLDQYD